MYTSIVNDQDQALAHLFFHCCLEDENFTQAVGRRSGMAVCPGSDGHRGRVAMTRPRPLTRQILALSLRDHPSADPRLAVTRPRAFYSAGRQYPSGEPR